jgi:hypothetical protein
LCPITALEYLFENKKIDVEEAEDILERVWVEYITKRIRVSSVDRLVEFDYQKNLFSKINENFKAEKILKQFFTAREMKTYFQKGEYKQLAN